MTMAPKFVKMNKNTKASSFTVMRHHRQLGRYHDKDCIRPEIKSCCCTWTIPLVMTFISLFSMELELQLSRCKAVFMKQRFCRV